MPKTVIGLDLSLNATGWAVCKDTIRCGTLSTPKKLRGDARLNWLDRQTQEIIGGTGFVVIEGASLASRSGVADEIYGLNRIVRLGLYRNQVPYVVVAPLQLKKFITGVAKAEKSLVVREVWRRWEIEVGDDNQADAVGLMQIGRALLGELTLTAFQGDVVAKIAAKHRDVLEGLNG